MQTDSKDRRDTIIQIRATQDEKAALDRATLEAGYQTVSEFVRQMAINNIDRRVDFNWRDYRLSLNEIFRELVANLDGLRVVAGIETQSEDWGRIQRSISKLKSKVEELNADR